MKGHVLLFKNLKRRLCIFFSMNLIVGRLVCNYCNLVALFFLIEEISNNKLWDRSRVWTAVTCFQYFDRKTTCFWCLVFLKVTYYLICFFDVCWCNDEGHFILVSRKIFKILDGFFIFTSFLCINVNKLLKWLTIFFLFVANILSVRNKFEFNIFSVCSLICLVWT